MRRIPDSEIIGKKFGRLTVIKETEPRFYAKDYPARMFLCKCECGTEKSVLLGSLQSGRTKSCGCQRRKITGDRARKHGMRGKSEFIIWQGIKQRCYYTNGKYYKNYGGRGIKMCEKWKNNFQAFWRDMGNRPGKTYTIERKDNDGNYCPENCRWATREEQGSNKRNNTVWEHEGKRMTLSQWAREKNIDRTTLSSRVNERKWTI